MAEKRKRGIESGHGDHDSGKKKLKRGFVVGPDNLPDGVYKRKTQKIKSALIERAQIKKNYAKLKKQGKLPDGDQPQTSSAYLEAGENTGETHEPSTTPHPDRQILMDKEVESPQAEQTAIEAKRRKRKPKPVPFKREYEQAQQRKAEAEEKRKAREEAERQRQRKAEERERFRKAMEKARRSGPNGQRKLGRESKPLLERVKRLVGESG